jgi:hypothetical protein
MSAQRVGTGRAASGQNARSAHAEAKGQIAQLQIKRRSIRSGRSVPITSAYTE